MATVGIKGLTVFLLSMELNLRQAG